MTINFVESLKEPKVKPVWYTLKWVYCKQGRKRYAVSPSMTCTCHRVPCDFCKMPSGRVVSKQIR